MTRGKLIYLQVEHDVDLPKYDNSTFNPHHIEQNAGESTHLNLAHCTEVLFRSAERLDALNLFGCRLNRN
jgi:hypothetical protein